jgi:endonuclease/exonuclease/phosphatase family metal-dependent hydrolase
MVFLCWNLNRRPLHQLVAELVQARQVDVVILLECEVIVAEILEALKAATGENFHLSDSKVQMKTIRVFTRFSHQFINALEEDHRYSIRHLRLPAQRDLLLAVVHFPSKLRWTEDSQAQECVELARMIDRAERRIGHFRTVMVGDLNMNPFEKGVVGTMGLNATMARNQAQKELRTVQRRKYRFFYNPMWTCFGDGQTSPPGTYHYDNNQHVTYFWNMFDQVLVRPSLIGNIDTDGIEIVHRVGGVSLLTHEGTPDGSVGSDHLPLLFSMRL